MHSCSSASGYERASTPCATLSRCEPSEDLTRLERWIAPRVAANGGGDPPRSAFRLLPTGLEAFVARAVLIELAERTLDLQYYIFHPDKTGSLIVDRLIAAADRGVRVRVLLDDWGTLEKKDESVAGLDAHPNIEVRLFNPYTHRSGLYRFAELLTSFARVNRRMHNKQFIADGIATILGGRNIGDEYFGVGELDFQDVDVLGAGPIAQQSTASFETYWNSPFAVPIAQLAKFAPDPSFFPAARTQLRDRCDGLRDSVYGKALVESHLARDLRADDLHVHWAAARVIADPPEKLTEPVGTRSDTYLGGQISPYARAARTRGGEEAARLENHHRLFTREPARQDVRLRSHISLHRLGQPRSPLARAEHRSGRARQQCRAGPRSGGAVRSVVEPGAGVRSDTWHQWRPAMDRRLHR